MRWNGQTTRDNINGTITDKYNYIKATLSTPTHTNVNLHIIVLCLLLALSIRYSNTPIITKTASRSLQQKGNGYRIFFSDFAIC